MHKKAIKSLAIAIISRAIEDLNDENEVFVESAHAFFKSKLYKLYAAIANINNPDELYHECKNRIVKIKKYYRKRKLYRKENKEMIK
jgi:hypothetical protein